MADDEVMESKTKDFMSLALALSWPAAFFFVFGTFVLSMALSDSDRPSKDLDKLTLETGVTSERIVTGEVVLLRVEGPKSLCYLTYRNGRHTSTDCLN